MASSSDWIAALDRDVGAVEPSAASGWLTQLQRTQAAHGFVEGAPFMASLPRSEPAAQAVPAADRPQPDPIAEAFARGQAAGRAAMEAEHAATGERQRALRLSFRAFDQAAIDSLASELADTVVALCSQALEGFATDPDQLLARCHAAARRLGEAPGDSSLHLNPDDLALLDRGALDPWPIVPDETVVRGGLRFEGPDGLVSDGPAEWRRAIAAAIRG